MNESQNKDFKTCALSTIVLKNEKNSISKGLLKIKFNFDLWEVHNYPLVSVLTKKIHIWFYDLIFQSTFNHYK